MQAGDPLLLTCHPSVLLCPQHLVQRVWTVLVPGLDCELYARKSSALKSLHSFKQVRNLKTREDVHPNQPPFHPSFLQAIAVKHPGTECVVLTLGSWYLCTVQCNPPLPLHLSTFAYEPSTAFLRRSISESRRKALRAEIAGKWTSVGE